MRATLESLVDTLEVVRSLPSWYREWRGRRAARARRAEIYEDLGSAIRNSSGTSASGWSILGQLEDWRDRAGERGQPIAHVFALWCARMAESGTFSAAVEETMPAMEVISIATAEHAGKLGVGLQELAADVRRLDGLQATVKGMVRELALPVIAIAVAILFFSISYTPQIASFMPVEKMPAMTRFFYGFGQWVTVWWPVPGVVVLGTYKLVDWSIENWVGRGRDLLDRIPLLPYPYYRDYTAARLLVALNRRMAQGDTIKRALEQVGKQSPPYLAMHCNRAIAGIEHARPTHEVLDTGLFNQALMDRISDYIKQGDFTSAIGNLSGQSFVKVEASILANMRLLKGVFTLLLYTFIALFFGLVINTIIAASGNFRL